MRKFAGIEYGYKYNVFIGERHMFGEKNNIGAKMKKRVFDKISFRHMEKFSI